jgi:regulator of cell morphogenesis and NO signaling
VKGQVKNDNRYSDWNDKPLVDLMNHIVDAHHAFCRQEVARLGTLFKEAIAGHGKDRPELKKMEGLFTRMAKDLQMHLVKEEQTLFPYIARVEEAVLQNAPVSWPAFGTVENPVHMMVLEHEQAGQELSQIRRLSNGYTPPSGASESLMALYDGLRAFDLDMTEHVHAEDQLLFPRAIAMEEQACTRREPV